MSRQFRRCFAVARSNRGNHSSGADTVRPSVNVTTRESAVKETSTASPTGLLVVVPVPSIDKLISILLDHSADYREFVAPEALRLRQCDRFQPVFRILFRAFNVYVPGLVAFPD